MGQNEHSKVSVIVFILSENVLMSFTAYAQGPVHNLLIISFDGFRWDYLQRTETPNFDKFIRGGVHARFGIKDAFITKTFPNHFSIVTGMWEESHGIINNKMFDPVLNETFAPGLKEAISDPAWFSTGAEPIWVTNQLQKTNGRSGVMMWVGGGAPIKWVRPSRYMPFNENVTDHDKVDTLIKWFTDEYPINLGLFYSMQPDHDGHTFGPESKEVTKRIAELDSIVGYILDQLKENQLLEDLNIIITSDHGFSSTPKDKAINLDDFIDPNSYLVTGLTPVAGIWPHEGKMDQVLKNLTKGAKQNGNFTVYKHEDVPDFFHYKYNRRIPPILAVAEDHFSFATEKEPWSMLGDHGYDNRNQNMHPFFLAMGPSFKKNYSVDTFNTVDIYPLMCHLLQITPAPNNGSMDVVEKLLLVHNDSEMSRVTFYTYLIGGVLVASVAIIFTIGVIRYRRCLTSNLRHYKYATLGSYSDQNNTVGSPTSQESSTTEAEVSILPLMSDAE